MKRRWQTSAVKQLLGCVGIALLLPCPAQAQNHRPGTPHVNSPVGTLSAAPSTHQNSLVSQPAPVGNNTNLLMTGNVGGAKHFRAALPYTSSHSFQVPVGSSYLDSFLRFSQNASSTGPSTAMYTPYYSLSKTVTRTQAGRMPIMSPLALQRKARTGARFPISADTEISPLALRTINAPMATDYPLAHIVYTDKLLGFENSSEALGIDSRLPKLSPSHDLLRREALSHLFDKILDSDKHTERQPDQIPQEGAENAILAHSFLPDPGTGFDTISPKTDLVSESEPLQQGHTAFDPGVTALQRPSQFAEQSPGNPLASAQAGQPGATQPNPVPTRDSARNDVGTLSSDAAAHTESLLAAHGTLSAYSQARYTTFMKAAEAHLKQGRFAQAISNYKLASIHKANDALAAAGRSYALLAQGEFTSSALFLCRALKARPDYARFLIDLPALIGSEKQLHQRVRELEKYLEYSGSFDLQFLLAYVSYQIGDLSRAQEAIAEAQKKQPDHQAVLAMQKVILMAL